MPQSIQPLTRRILSRLSQAQAEEPDPWLRDDLEIAHLIVAHAARGDAVLCSPDVLATYEVLGLHPEKVWPAMQARHEALGFSDAPVVPKKPPRSVKLWCNENGVRAINSHAAMQEGSPRTTISVPMAAPSIAALYPNSNAPSSAKKGAYEYTEWLAIVRYSGAPPSVRRATLNALTARGAWPGESGPANGIICVSLDGMMLGDKDGDGNCVRSTARWRARRACALGYWRHVRLANSWSNCPKCKAKRQSAECPCGYVGKSKTPEGKPNFDEFCRPHMYEIDIEKFRNAPRCTGLRHFSATTYSEFKRSDGYRQRKEQKKREWMEGQAEVTPIRKPTTPATPPRQPAPAAPLPQREKPAAVQPPAKQPKLTRRESAKFIADMAVCMRGVTTHVESAGGYGYDLQPDDPRYRAPMNWREALVAVCDRWKRTPESVIEALKFWGYKVETEGEASP